ncbi:hypothetical protein PYW08_010128 [Mythimna loreyi]|uniref:Uncharacterized protein n=1 Tax=Mythimna loreyi TaxID=667449 RepID=A0ACC2Q6P9_9NEOP|nr:hypothetical protein PYW08_010128 [Mythimna loreyi]
MKSVVLLSFVFLGLASATVEGPIISSPELLSPKRDPNELPLAEKCNPDWCKLPKCRCSGTDIPGGLSPRITPQFITITFSNGINVRNIQTYREILYGRKNFNGCPLGATFYVSHEYTDYTLVNELYNQGYEIALNSISHRTPQAYWAKANYSIIKEEIADQRIQMAHFANISQASIKGVRLPFLQMSGNSSFQVMADYGFDYDASWPTVTRNFWPYSLDYATTQYCKSPPCPTASIPNTWVQPMVSWIDSNGNPCGMVDGCHSTPDLNDVDGWYWFIVRNFNIHYHSNRAPFGFHIHEWFLSSNPAVKAALVSFMNTIRGLNDVFIVNSSEVLKWVRNPIPVAQYRAKPCREWRPTTCFIRSCGPVVGEHNGMNYWMRLCNRCPRVYPWTGNPLGI